MWLSSEIEWGTNGQRERNSSDSISSLSICINRPLFDAGGRQPSTNRRTEVKLKKKKRMVFFQKNIPPEINNNNYNYSKKKEKKRKTTHQLLRAKTTIMLLFRGSTNNSEEHKTSVLEICISQHESNWALRDDFEQKDRKRHLWILKLRPSCEYYAVSVAVEILARDCFVWYNAIA